MDRTIHGTGAQKNEVLLRALTEAGADVVVSSFGDVAIVDDDAKLIDALSSALESIDVFLASAGNE